MLNCTANSRAKKTAGIAQTYRAGQNEIYATCPDSCVLKPHKTGTVEIDREYESAVRRAVPKRASRFFSPTSSRNCGQKKTALEKRFLIFRRRLSGNARHTLRKESRRLP